MQKFEYFFVERREEKIIARKETHKKVMQKNCFSTLSGVDES